jgi:FixJ family two-component response regulator
VAPAFPDLTPREREVLDLLAEGGRNSEIARQLGMKLQVPDRTAAAIKARDARPRPD